MKIRNLLTNTVYALAYRHRSGIPFYETEYAEFTVLKSPRGCWYADPMLFEYEGHEWLFVEKMDMKRRKGTIAVAEVHGKEIGPFIDVIIEDFHLSYPMVFSKRGRVFLIPEAGRTKSLFLYECLDFPYKWERKCILIRDKILVDSNFYNDGTDCFLITGEMDPTDGSNTKTLLYDANAIEDGVLVPVLSNQNATFSHGDRGGGNLFRFDGITIRPTQFGTVTEYGQGLNFYQFSIKDKCIDQSLITSVEKESVRVNIHSCLKGTHTYCISRELEIIDIQYDVLATPASIIRTIRRKLESLFK